MKQIIFISILHFAFSASAVPEEVPKTYSVQAGDNLWNLSETFFGDPFFWPKLWALNSDHVFNPHIIEINDVLNFEAGSLIAAPSLSFGAKKSSSKNYVSLMENLPPSFPSVRLETKAGSPEFQVIPSKKTDFGDQYLSYRVQQGELKSSGQVIETEVGLKTASENQYIFVNLSEGNTGDIFTVVRKLADLEDKFEGDVPYPLEFQSQIRILDLVKPEDGIYRAIIEKSIAPTEVGSKVVRGTLPMFSLSRPVSEGSGVTKIIGAQYSSSRKIVSSGTIVFLQGGSNRGFEKDKIFTIFSERSLRYIDSFVENDHPAIGRLQIIDSTPEYSTAFILEAASEVYVGDKVGR